MATVYVDYKKKEIKNYKKKEIKDNTKKENNDDKNEEIKEVFKTEPWPYGNYERTRFHPFNYPGPGMLMYLSPPIEPCTYQVVKDGVEKEFKVEDFSSKLFETRIRKKDLKSSKQKYSILRESDVEEYQTQWKYGVYKRENNSIIGSLKSTKTEDREEHLILRARRDDFATNNKNKIKNKKAKNLNCRIQNDIDINLINQDQEERNVDDYLKDLFVTEKLYPVVFYLSGSNINPVKMTVNLKRCLTSQVFFKVICHDLMNYTNQNFGDVFVVSKKISADSELCLAIHYNRMFLSLYIFAKNDIFNLPKYFIEIGDITLEPNFLKYQSSFNFKNMPIAIEAVGYENVSSEITKAPESCVNTIPNDNSDPNVQDAFYQNEEYIHFTSEEGAYPEEKGSYDQTVQHVCDQNARAYDPRGQQFYCVPSGRSFHYDPREQPISFNPGGQPAFYEPIEQPAYYEYIGQPAYYEPSGQPAYISGGQPAYISSGQPAYISSGQSAYISIWQPAYTPIGQPTYTPIGQPTYTSSGQPTYTPIGQPTYTTMGQPAYISSGQPAYVSGQSGYVHGGQQAYYGTSG